MVEKTTRSLEAAGIEVVYGTNQFCTSTACSAGVAQVPAIGFGPSLAHVVNEYIAIEDLLRAVRGYEGIILAVLAE